ncbi:MAG: uracil-DNA glycosylase [Rhodospirillaceae bacterium]|nr:uracil-DNA glycosylase [Rhodospirillaceae bacterium]
MPGFINPPRDCPLCPRLAVFRAANRAISRSDEPEWHNAPVPGFGTLDGRLLIVGLAPGLKGANRTGRPFTGDYAGDLLYPTLQDFGFATGEYHQHIKDGLELVDARLTNAVRCVPPQNKPIGSEIATCNAFLATEIAAMNRLEAILALGRIAHEAVLRALDLKMSAAKFVHNARHLVAGRRLYDSYHCSRYNTNTGRLTVAMFRQVFEQIRHDLKD